MQSKKKKKELCSSWTKERSEGRRQPKTKEMTQKQRTARQRTSHAARLPPKRVENFSTNMASDYLSNSRSFLVSPREDTDEKDLLYSGQTNPEAQASLSSSKKATFGHVSAPRYTLLSKKFIEKNKRLVSHGHLQRLSDNPAYLQLYSSWRLLRHGVPLGSCFIGGQRHPNNPCS